MSDERLLVALRLVGASQVALAFGHAGLWRWLGWSREIATLSPLTRRVFVAHVAVVAFVLSAFGLLGVARPDLLVTPSDLGRLVAASGVLFWSARLLAQPLFFDPVMLLGSRWRAPLRVCATLLFGSYVLVYAWTLATALP